MMTARSLGDCTVQEDATFKSEKFNELFAVLEDLLKRIADTDDPHIRRKRALVREEMLAVQNDSGTLQPVPAEKLASKFAPAPAQEAEAAWGPQALVALAGAAVALSVFRHST